METLLQQLINGLSLGAIYALIALGYTMVYGVLRLINFAHGDVYMLGAFAGYFMANALNLDANPSVVGTALVDALRASLDAENRATAKTVDAVADLVSSLAQGVRGAKQAAE